MKEIEAINNGEITLIGYFKAEIARPENKINKIKEKIENIDTNSKANG